MHHLKTLKIPAVLAFMLVLSGCFEDREFMFEEQQFEWTPPNPANNELDKTVTMNADQSESETAELTITYAGEHQDEELTAVFEVNPEQSQAEEGVHFDFVTGHETTVPANSSESEPIEIEVYPEEIENGTELSAVFEITDDSDVEPMANYRQFEFDMEKMDVEFDADLEGTDDHDEVEGSVSINGNTSEQIFEASISLSELEQEETYNWSVHAGTCADDEGVIGDGTDYDEMETGEDDNSATASSEIDYRLNQNEEYHVRVFIDGMLGNDLVTCGELQGS